MDICWCGCNQVEPMFVQTTYDYLHQLLRGTGSLLQEQDWKKNPRYFSQLWQLRHFKGVLD